MNNKKIFVICGFLIVAVIACIGLGIRNNKVEKKEIFISEIIPEKTEAEMYLGSDVIVKGTVEKILDSKWSNPDFYRGEDISNVLQTDIVVNVDEVYEGALLGNTVVVRIDKGEDEAVIVHSEGYPDFEIGENVVLFLSRDDSDAATDEDYYVLTGMKYGKYTLKEDVYVNEKGQINPQDIKEKLKKLKEQNPNYKEEEQERQKQIIEKNKELFGE